jgi:hypothetical protein
MIRDPSDGSVREPATSDGRPASVSNKAQLPSDDKPLMSPTVSGLQTGSSKPENMARLVKSREWLSDYRAGKTNPKPEGE